MNMNFIKEGNKIKFTDTSGISRDTWTLLLNRINYLGYDLEDEDMLKAYFDRGHFLNEDQSLEVLKVFGEFHDESSVSEEEIKEYTKRAVESFGLTNRLDLAGYLLTDGNLLKLSYNDYIRDIDHREISEIFEDLDIGDEHNAPMDRFMKYGHIRLVTRGIDLMYPPTQSQRHILAEIIRRHRKEDYTYFYVDVSNTNGQKVKHFEYDFPTFSTVMNDIDTYFCSIKIG